MFINLSCSPNQIFYTGICFGKIQPIFDAEKWCWKSEFDKVVHEVWRWYHLVRKCLFPIDAYMVLCPTCTKNLTKSLFNT